MHGAGFLHDYGAAAAMVSGSFPCYTNVVITECSEFETKGRAKRGSRMILRNMTRLEIMLMLSLTIPVTLVLLWPQQRWPLMLMIVWLLGLGLNVWVMQRRKHRKHCEYLLKHAQMSAIRTLSHHRHDWMNEMQILYGYLRLNKLDKAVDVMDRIRERMEHDSKISQIGTPELATFLLSFRTVCDAMRLDVKVQDGLTLDRFPYDADKLSRAVMALINVIRFRAVTNLQHDNVLTLSFYELNGGLTLEMSYEGELAAADSVQFELRKCVEGLGDIAVREEPAERPLQERTMVIRFPLQA
ncbi:Spo0B domain-containing protein [Cohnella kolymensis]|uniref:Spo0B domain-containing protein n=1 Tax=Cohnella kolymensis TaxID=1590652 RepID=UPI0006979545|nr:Spo0B domain-containing protein [Cohnella kolymensis]